MPSPSDKKSSAPAEADAAAKTATVLVVDDEPTIVEIVGRYMERAGFETYRIEGKRKFRVLPTGLL